MKHIEIEVPDGVSGEWKVDTFVVRQNEIGQYSSFFKTGRGVPLGTYKRLKRGGTTVMSNTPDEIRDFSSFVEQAEGSVLVNGLGLGVLLQALVNKPEVTKVKVIEISEDVLALVAGTYEKHAKVEIIKADCFEYTPPKGERFNAVWHDIWDSICADNLAEMNTLHRKYGRRADYQSSWCRLQCREQQKDWARYC